MKKLGLLIFICLIQIGAFAQKKGPAWNLHAGLGISSFHLPQGILPACRLAIGPEVDIGKVLRFGPEIGLNILGDNIRGNFDSVYRYSIPAFAFLLDVSPFFHFRLSKRFQLGIAPYAAVGLAFINHFRIYEGNTVVESGTNFQLPRSLALDVGARLRAELGLNEKIGVTAQASYTLYRPNGIVVYGGARYFAIGAAMLGIKVKLNP